MSLELKSAVYGAILGDLCGRPFEYKFKGELPKKENVDIYNPDSDFSDDTILTLASCKFLLDGRINRLTSYYKNFALDYQDRGFGKGFIEWARMDGYDKNDSWGNGSIMRISPFLVLKDLSLVCESVNTSHCHPISLRAAIRLYELYHNFSIPEGSIKLSNIEVKSFKEFTSKADDTIEKVEEIFYTTNSTHEAIKLAVSLGGDTDTVASIVGALCAYHYKDITLKDIEYIKSKLDKDLNLILSNI